MKGLHLVALVGLASRLAVAQADPRVQPGKTFYVDFPELGQTSEQKPARMGISLPSDYDPDRPCPLLVWFGGGYGTDSPAQARSIAGSERFVCVGLPYRKEGEKVGGDGSEGLWSTPWSYYEIMLNKLEVLVPNIDPAQRACAGFSSGGAAILHLLGNTRGGVQKYFSAYMPGGAGWDMGGLSSIRNRPMLAFMGENDGRFEGYAKLEKSARSAGVDITFLIFKNTGHSMPKEYLPEMRAWLFDKLVYCHLPELQANMEAAFRARKWGQAYHLAHALEASAGDTRPEHAAAREMCDKLLPIGEKEAATLLARPPSLQALQQFVRDWPDCSFAKPIEAKCNGIAEQQLGRIMSADPVSLSYLKKFLSMWEGFAAYDQALARFDVEAAKGLDKLLAMQEASTIKAQKLSRYIGVWSPAPSVNRARAALSELAQSELEAIKTIQSAGMRRGKLQSFIRCYADTPQAVEAQQLLDAR